jgi:hypothetical protein
MALGVFFVTAWALRRGLNIWPPKRERWPLFLLSSLFTVQIALLNYGTCADVTLASEW